MNSCDNKQWGGLEGARPILTRLAVASTVALLLTACKLTEEPGAHVAGWTTVDARQRHPIMVSEQPANLTVRVARGASGLSPQQRAQVYDFVNRYSARDVGNARIIIGVPSGSANEIAAMHALADLRELVRTVGIAEANVMVQAYRADGNREPPIRMSYTRFVAEAPDCGHWPTNLGEDPRNLPYPNFGCATQRNLAAQVSNPADLLGPRTMQPGSAERRDTIWNSYVKGESTVAKKDNEEKVQVKNAQ
jgi:pilus assembly protein CpaD